MTIEKIEAVLNTARADGPLAEFMALQDIIASVTLRNQASLATTTDQIREIYKWYVRQLLRLNDALGEERRARQGAYQLEPLEDNNTLLACIRIQALLAVIPEVKFRSN